MSVEDWTKDLEYDDLPEAHRKLADVIGLEAAIKMCSEMGGLQYYVPVLEGLQTAARVKAIRKEYNGSNVQKLARKYNLAVRTVYLAVQGKDVQIDGQLSITDLPTVQRLL